MFRMKTMKDLVLATKINPVLSESRLSPDRSLTVTLGDEPFSMTTVAEGGGTVELSVPAKPGPAGKETLLCNTMIIK